MTDFKKMPPPNIVCIKKRNCSTTDEIQIYIECLKILEFTWILWDIWDAILLLYDHVPKGVGMS